MFINKKYYLFFSFVLLSSQFVVAQQSSADSVIAIADTTSPADNRMITVGEIIITGNRKTKEFIMLREIPFKSGEEYPLQVIILKMEEARRQLMNTSLFHTAVVAAKNFEGDKINITVIVKERWYLFPVPYLKPVDRNLNQWIVEQKASLNRVNYGAKVLYNNATGKNDKFRMSVIAGYTRQLSFSYDRLYIDKKLNWGLKTGFATGNNREMNYTTINDKQIFFKDENSFVKKFINGYAELTYRRAIKARHSFGVSYNIDEVTDTIVALNPGYFAKGENRISFPTVFYSMSYFDLDYIPYATKGYAAQIGFSKSGINQNFNLWQMSARVSASWHMWPKMFFNLNMYGGIKLPFKQPYSNKRFLGYGDTFLQGYEYYVVDGVTGGYLKATITREILNFSIRIPPIKKGKEAERIPVRIFAKTYGNTGYVYDPEPGLNTLSNKMLYSGGFGIDILTFYDVTFKLEWTFNQLGQNGIFVHRKSVF